MLSLSTVVFRRLQIWPIKALFAICWGLLNRNGSINTRWRTRAHLCKHRCRSFESISENSRVHKQWAAGDQVIEQFKAVGPLRFSFCHPSRRLTPAQEAVVVVFRFSQTLNSLAATVFPGHTALWGCVCVCALEWSGSIHRSGRLPHR